MELDNEMENKDSYAWFVHPFDASQWIYKKVKQEDIQKLYEQDKVYIGMSVMLGSMREGGLVLGKIMNANYNKLIININAPNELDTSEPVIYNFGNELPDDNFVFNKFKLDERLFNNGLHDDEANLSKNNFIKRIIEMKNSGIHPNENIEDYGDEDDDEEDDGE